MPIWTNIEAKLEISKLKSSGQKVVFTNGCFDILHKGHMAYLKSASKLGDTLIIGLNSDESVNSLKGPGRPINNETDRAEVLLSLGFIDAVVIFNEETPRELISELLPDVLVKGGDYNKDEIAGASDVETNGGEVKILPFLKGYSTTNILKKRSGKGLTEEDSVV